MPPTAARSCASASTKREGRDGGCAPARASGVEKSTPTPISRLERRQQIAVAAAELEHAQTRRNEKAVHVLEPPVVRTRGPTALAARGGGDSVPLRDAAFAVGVGVPTVQPLEGFGCHAAAKAQGGRPRRSPAAFKRRTSAEPTRPRCPATENLASRGIACAGTGRVYQRRPFPRKIRGLVRCPSGARRGVVEGFGVDQQKRAGGTTTSPTVAREAAPQVRLSAPHALTLSRRWPEQAPGQYRRSIPFPSPSVRWVPWQLRHRRFGTRRRRRSRSCHNSLSPMRRLPRA